MKFRRVLEFKIEKTDTIGDLCGVLQHIGETSGDDTPSVEIFSDLSGKLTMYGEDYEFENGEFEVEE